MNFFGWRRKRDLTDGGPIGWAMGAIAVPH